MTASTSRKTIVSLPANVGETIGSNHHPNELVKSLILGASSWSLQFGLVVVEINDSLILQSQHPCGARKKSDRLGCAAGAPSPGPREVFWNGTRPRVRVRPAKAHLPIDASAPRPRRLGEMRNAWHLIRPPCLFQVVGRTPGVSFHHQSDPTLPLNERLTRSSSINP